MTSHRSEAFCPAAALVVLVLTLAAPAGAATFTVTNTNTSGAGSLAKAIADANLTEASDTIEFDIDSSAQVHTIAGTLPAITQPLIIDGYTQFGATRNSLPLGATNASLRIQLSGSGTGIGGRVLRVDNGPTEIRGLVISGIPKNGVGIEVAEAEGSTTIRGCFIGTDATGLVDSSIGTTGVLVHGVANIGSSSIADRNLISGNNGAGIQLSGVAINLFNNLIGTNAAGAPVLGNGTGVVISSAEILSNAGGSSAATQNVIAGNVGAGYRILPAALGVSAIGVNSFFDNGSLAIDLLGDGVTANDEGDLDSGPNDLQNFPVLTFARVNGTALRLEGHLESQPGTYTLRFFSNASPDPSGFGEGEEFLGAVEVTIADGETFAAFGVMLELAEDAVDTFFVAATTQSANTGATSEFSASIEVLLGGAELVVTNSNDSGPGSLRAALTSANANADLSTIVFDIASPQPISLESALVVSAPVIIDAYTQPGSSPNTLQVGSNAQLQVVIDGAKLEEVPAAIVVVESGAILRGLVIQNATSGIVVFGTTDVRVEGCFIGTDATGTFDLGNDSDGISTGAGPGTIIGGLSPTQRNIISGNNGSGIVDRGEGTLILNNIIGGDAFGLGKLGNGLDGILLFGTGAIVGDDGSGAGNLIRGNARSGVAVEFGFGNEILANSIFENEGVGIDIDPDDGSPGVTDNDANDGDGGGNGRQNFPVITVELQPAGLLVGGTLDVPSQTVDATYTIRVFANTTCDPSGHGQGEIFLGAEDVVLSGADEEFEFTLPVIAPEGAVFTATATDQALGNTSEFSACFDPFFVPAVDCGDASGNGEISAADGLATLRAAVGSGECELCRCDVNDSGGITASDALLVLKSAVGQSVLLECPACV